MNFTKEFKSSNIKITMTMRETRHDTAVFSVQVFKNDRLIKITTEPYEIVSNDKKAESINFEIVCMDRFCEIIRNKEKHGIN